MPTVTQCRLISEEFGLELKGQNSNTLVWRVHVDGHMSSAEALQKAIFATPDPVLSVGTYIGNGCFVLRVSMRYEHVNNCKIFTATAECGPWPSDQGSPDGVGTTDGVFNHPLARKVVWAAERVAEQVPVYKDHTGAALVNSAGQDFEETPTKDRYYTVYVAQKNFATLEEIVEINDTFDDTCSSDTVLGRPAQTMRFIGCEISQPIIEAGITYYQGTFRLAYKKEGWKTPLWNRGWAYWDRPKTNAGARLVSKDGNGQPLAAPVRLALDGTLLAQNQADTATEYLLYKPVAYASLVADPTFIPPGP